MVVYQKDANGIGNSDYPDLGLHSLPSPLCPKNLGSLLYVWISNLQEKTFLSLLHIKARLSAHGRNLYLTRPSFSYMSKLQISQFSHTFALFKLIERAKPKQLLNDLKLGYKIFADITEISVVI